MPTEIPNRNVYILGAGFSAPAGAPLVNDFLDRSRELYDDPRSSMDEAERRQFKQVFDFKRSMSLAREKFLIDLDNIEKLFGLAEISLRLGEPVKETRDAIVYLIAKTLQLATSWPKLHRPTINLTVKSGDDSLKALERLRPVGPRTGQLELGLDMYDYFAALVTGALDDPEQRTSRKDTIITFNYDLLCDHALLRLGVRPNYHLDPDLQDSSQVPDSDKAVDLLKLHGSTNWGICGTCGKNVQVLDEKLTQDPYHLRGLRCSACKTSDYRLLLIPPSWDKSEHQAVISRIWAKAVDEIRQASRLCIIGYSMPEADLFFQYLLTLALSRNEQLYRLIVVDKVKSEDGALLSRSQPASDSVEQRYRQLLDPMFQKRRFSFYGDGVAQFLAHGNAMGRMGRGELVAGILGYT
jgi:NAD-dependent SIR2 family protein deacetylase